MLVGCLTVFTMLLYAYISCKLREDEDLIKRLVLSQMLFWCTYTLISGDRSFQCAYSYSGNYSDCSRMYYIKSAKETAEKKEKGRNISCL